MRAALRWVLPPLIAAAFLVLGVGPYTHLLASGTTVSRAAIPPARTPIEVRVEGSAVKVFTGEGRERVPSGPIVWNLPVLACLWAWAVGRRWGWLALACAAVALLHVLLLDVAIRAALGSAAGLPHRLYRAWVHGGGAVVAAVLVAVARAWPSRRPADPPAGPTT